MESSLKKGLNDYLEILQMAGVSEIPFEIIPLKNGTIESEMSKKKETVPTEDRHLLLKQVAEKVAKCKKCPELVANRTKTVFGAGNPHSELVFLGEAPGADEDKQGIPFVGRAGKLLTDIITQGMKLKREDVYICNILRCRPPGNRNPSSDEAEKCSVFLNQTLDIIKPKYIFCLGSIAATNLFQTDLTIGKLRGKVHDYRGIQVVCTYHPAYLLRNPPAKTATWEDVKLLMKIMGLPIPGK